MTTSGQQLHITSFPGYTHACSRAILGFHTSHFLSVLPLLVFLTRDASEGGTAFNE